MSNFTQIIENNSWEGESYNYYFDSLLFAKEIALFKQLFTLYPSLTKAYKIGKTLTQKEVNTLLKRSGSGYISYHNLVIEMKFMPSLTLENNEINDPLYKGNGLIFGNFNDLAQRKRWEMIYPGTPMPLKLSVKDGWAHPLYDNGILTNEWVIRGHDAYAFGDGSIRITPGLLFIDDSTGKIVKVDKVALCEEDEILQFIEEHAIIDSFSGGLVKGARFQSYFTVIDTGVSFSGLAI